MQLTARLPLTRQFGANRRTRPTTAPTPGPTVERASANRGGGPEDRALYACECGYAFQAAVTTSVGCPHCGARQAW